MAGSREHAPRLSRAISDCIPIDNEEVVRDPRR